MERQGFDWEGHFCWFLRISKIDDFSMPILGIQKSKKSDLGAPKGPQGGGVSRRTGTHAGNPGIHAGEIGRALLVRLVTDGSRPTVTDRR